MSEVASLVRSRPLVTLTGVGGVGKTRLALAVGAELAPDFPDGVWLVELASVGDPDAVPDAIATALGITPQGGAPVIDAVAEALAGRQVLVVVDNCEHLLAAAASRPSPRSWPAPTSPASSRPLGSTCARGARCS